MRLSVLLALVTGSSALHAQNIPQGQDVGERPHPDYSQVGVDVGGFTLLPSVTTTLAGTDNYLATTSNRKANLGLLVRPDLTWRSDWGRHRVDGSVFYEQRLNAPLKRENSSQYGISASGVYDISRESSFRLAGSARRLVEDRRRLNSLQASSGPVRYDLLRGEGVFKQVFGSLELQGTASLDRLKYRDAELLDGSSLSQRYRNYTGLSLGSDVQYKFANGFGVVVTTRYFKNDYDLGAGDAGFIEGQSLQRDSTGKSIQGGITLELSNLIFGTIQAGYLWRNYSDPRINDVSSPSFNASLLWNVTPLTSLRGGARRSVEESSSVVSAGSIRTDFNLAVHHELYRNILLTGELEYGRFTPISIGSKGNEYSLALGARYLMSRRITVNGELRHSQRDSSNAFQRYRATEARVSLRYGI